MAKTSPSLRPPLSSTSFPAEITYPMQRADENEIRSPEPPRYSTLLGALPRLAPFNPIATEDDGESPLGPPAYSSASQQPIHSIETANASSSTVSPLHIERNESPVPSPYSHSIETADARPSTVSPSHIQRSESPVPSSHFHAIETVDARPSTVSPSHIQRSESPLSSSYSHSIETADARPSTISPSYSQRSGSPAPPAHSHFIEIADARPSTVSPVYSQRSGSPVPSSHSHSIESAEPRSSTISPWDGQRSQSPVPSSYSRSIESADAGPFTISPSHILRSDSESPVPSSHSHSIEFPDARPPTISPWRILRSKSPAPSAHSFSIEIARARPSAVSPSYTQQRSRSLAVPGSHSHSHAVETANAKPSILSPSYNIQRSQSLVPASHSREEIHKHESYLINGGKTKPWATLKVNSSNSDWQNKPHFAEGDIIRGCFELDLDTPQNISSISLALRGSIATAIYETGGHTFLEQPIKTWDRKDGDPRSTFLLPGATVKKFDGKLSGQYTWPFWLAFPKEVTIRGQHKYLSKTYPTPRSFFENGTNPSVKYELILRINHGLLRADSKLNVEIAYVPDIIPNTFSLLRKAAYRENATIPGPDEDPKGWSTLPNANIHGKLSFNDRCNDRHAYLRCTLSLAKPQCYTRGSVIPCHLSIHSTNTEALDILANHKYIRVCLVRRIHYYEDPKQAYSRTQQFSNATGDHVVPPGVREQAETIARAVWWSSSTDELDRRCLEGEIHLDKELQPSSQFLLFKVLYTIELYPFESSVFKCTNSGFANTDSLMRTPKAFLSHPVSIATQHLQGQVPVPATKLKSQCRKRRGFRPPEFTFCADETQTLATSLESYSLTQ